jgi:hypothetical protein
MVEGNEVMVAPLLVTTLGIWLTAAPDLLHYTGYAATNDHILGPLIASCAFVAIWEVMRGIRWINVALGGWLLLAPWLLGYGETISIFNSLIVGISVTTLSFIKGKMTHRFGGGWAALLE